MRHFSKGAEGSPTGTPSKREILIATIMRPDRYETGVQTHFRALLHYAEKTGTAVRLVSPFDLPRQVVLPAFGVGKVGEMFSKALYVWWYRRGHFLLLRRRLKECLKPGAPVIVYAQDPLSAKAALDLKRAGYPLEVVEVVHHNTSEADEWAEKGYIRKNGRLYRQIIEHEMQVLPQVDRLVFPSRYAQQELRRLIPRTSQVPSWCIPNFVDQPTFAAADRVSGDLLTIGMLEPRKNHSFLLRVVAEAHRMGFPYRLTIVGAGPLRSTLMRLATELHIDRHVTLLGYFPNAASLLAAHRAYVHAAVRENLPITLLEALAAGRPIFAAPVGGIPEVFRHDLEGCYWDLDDPRAAAYQLVRVLDTPSRLQTMMAAASSRYETQFATEKVAPRLLRVISGEDQADQVELLGAS